MKSKSPAKSSLLSAAVFISLCASGAHAGTTPTTFSFQKADLRQDGALYGSGASYTGVVDGRITDNSATSPLSTGATATLGNQFQSGAPNGQQHCGLFSYDLTELNDFISANTSAFSSVVIQSVSFKIISAGGVSGSAMSLNLYGTDPFTASGSTWSNYTTGTPWTVPYQSIANNTVAYGYTGGPSALTAQLGGGTLPNTTVVSGSPLTWNSSANFVSALSTALARPDKTLYLTARGGFFNTGDNRLNINTSATATVDNRPELLISLSVNTYSDWTGASGTSWATAGNWTSAPAAGDNVRFNSSSTSNLATTLNQDFSLNSLILADPAGSVSIAGSNSLTLGAGGLDLSAATQNLTITAPVVTSAAQSWNVASGRTLGISGGVSGGGSITVAGAGKVSLGASDILANGAGAGNLAVNGTLDLNGTSQSINALTGSGTVDNTAAGTSTLTVGNNNAGGTFSGTLTDTGGALTVIKTGSGSLALSGANDFSGGFTNNGAGNVSPQNDNAFGSGPVVSNAGIIYPTAASFTYTNALTLNNSTLEIGGGNNHTITWNGPVTATGISGLSADGGTVGITLGSTLNIAGATFSSFANGTTNNINGDISGAGGNLKITSGTLQLSGANTYTGTSILSGSAVLRLQSTGTVSSSSDVVINGAGNFNIRNNVGWIYSGAITGDGTGSISINSGSDAELAGPISGVATVSTNSAGTNAKISGGIGGTSTSVTIAGASVLHLSGSNSYGTSTNVTNGNLILDASGTLPATTPMSIASATLDAGTFTNATGPLAVTGAATINLGSGGKVAFANSNGAWTGTLNITGAFVSGSSVRFGTDATGLDGSQLALITATGFGPFSIDGSGYLTATATGSSYTTWAGAALFEDDANNDGVKNGLAWILGAASPSASAVSLLPKAGTPAGYLTLAFNRVNPYAPAKLYIEYSSNLSGWTKLEIPAATGTIPTTDIEVVVIPGTPDAVTVKIPTATHAVGGKLFGRLSATEN